MGSIVHWLWYHMGLNSGNSPWYLFPSGWGGIILVSGSIMSVPYQTWKKNNCHTRWCLRIGHHPWRHPETGLEYFLCRKHHPDHPGKRMITAVHIKSHYSKEQQNEHHTDGPVGQMSRLHRRLQHRSR